MSMNVSSKVGYPAPWPQATQTPAPAAATANPAAPAPAAPPAATPAPAAPVDSFEAAPANTYSAAPTPNEPAQYAADPTGADNVFGQAQLEKGNWATDTVPLRQANDVDCGAAVATMLAGAKNPMDAQQQSDKLAELQKQFGTEKGTNADQMKKMLANVGVEVRRGDEKLDNDALAGTLSMGGKTTALVDSNKIRPDGDPNASGAAHWVVVDGMNDKGEYRVRDPSDGSSYYVPKEKLGAAMDAAHAEHGGGGMLFVESAKADESTLNAVGDGKGTALGDGSGTGSKAWKNSTETTMY